MERPYDRTLRYIWNHELSKLNDHVPAKKIPLSTLLETPHPAFPLRDGTQSAMSREELLDIATCIPQEFHSRIELPFIFLRRMDLGRGTYTLLGSKLEKFCVERLLGLEKAQSTSWSLFKTIKLRRCFYMYHLFQFRKRYRSLSTIAIATAPTSPNNSPLNQKPWQTFKPDLRSEDR